LFAGGAKSGRDFAFVQQSAAFQLHKLLDIPIGLLINFHEVILKNGISRMILPKANQTADVGEDISL
jgi:hypothetical protein